MEERSIDGWERLTCLCGQNRFAPIIFLRWRPSGGVTQEPGGYFCLECHGVVDASVLIQRAQVNAKRRELKELEGEIADTLPTVAAATSMKASKKGA